jgi:uncharacterized membrane protein
MERRERSSKTTLLIVIIFLVFLVWSLLQFIAPVILPSESVNELDGHVGVTDNPEKIDNMSAPWSSIYNCGDVLCHQKAERTFFINGNEMPFCARCTAIWLGLAIGLAFMIFYKINLDEKFILIIFIGLIPIGIDGFGQMLGFWESSNLIRLVTGLLVGIICGVAIGIIVDELGGIVRSRKTESN